MALLRAAFHLQDNIPYGNFPGGIFHMRNISLSGNFLGIFDPWSNFPVAGWLKDNVMA